MRSSPARQRHRARRGLRLARDGAHFVIQTSTPWPAGGPPWTAARFVEAAPSRAGDVTDERRRERAPGGGAGLRGGTSCQQRRDRQLGARHETTLALLRHNMDIQATGLIPVAR